MVEKVKIVFSCWRHADFRGFNGVRKLMKHRGKIGQKGVKIIVENEIHKKEIKRVHIDKESAQGG